MGNLLEIIFDLFNVQIIGLVMIIVGVAGIWDNLFNNRETIWGGKSWGSGFTRFRHLLEGLALIIVGLILLMM